MPLFNDRTGIRIGRVNILEPVREGHCIKWKCLCDCGKTFICTQAKIKNGHRFECNNCVFERRRGIDLVGRKFGRWTVVRREIDSNNKTTWFCLCDCGNTGNVSNYALGKKGKSQSCGCLGRKQKSKWINTTLYPPANGLSKSRFYSIRSTLVQKCYNINHPTYFKFGGKGITICELWRNSAKDMYGWALAQGWREGVIFCLKEGFNEFSPETVYIIDRSDFNSEISLKGGLQISYRGETHSVSKWAEIMGINVLALRRNIKNLPSVEEAFRAHYKKIVFAKNEQAIQQCIEEYKSGCSISRIARQYGVHPGVLRYHFITRGIRIRDNFNNKPEVTDAEVTELTKQGWTVGEIAKKFGVSWSCVSYRLMRIRGEKRKR
jgi:hypothetical protein